MKIIMMIALISMIGMGCAGVKIPKLMGPAENVNCTITRNNGSPVGRYKCTIEGAYSMEGFGIF